MMVFIWIFYLVLVFVLVMDYRSNFSFDGLGNFLTVMFFITCLFGITTQIYLISEKIDDATRILGILGNHTNKGTEKLECLRDDVHDVKSLLERQCDELDDDDIEDD